MASIVTGLTVLLYGACQLWDPGASRAQHRFAAQLRVQWRHAHAAHHLLQIHLRVGHPFAELRIPAFGRHWRFAVIEGTTLAQLADGPGHVPGTQLPGQPGNFAVAAHDITAGNPFLHLSDLRRGDAILVTTVNATYRYRVLSERVVRYTDTSVLDPVPGHPARPPARPLITLITCTPVTLAFTPWRIAVTGALASTRWARPSGA